MKKSNLLLPLITLILAGSCNETEPIISEMIDLEEAKTVFISDSVSFVMKGKRYTSNPNLQHRNRSFGNQGVNLRLSDTMTQWYHTAPNGQYWIGAPDSVQYHMTHKIYMEEGQFKLTFIANRRKAEMSQLGTMYFPRKYETFYQLGDYSYAVDFNRFGTQEGVAISLFIYDVGRGATFSDKSPNEKSNLTAASQGDSKFKITKITEIKGTNDVRVEGTFETNLFDKSESKAVRVTEGYFRSTLFKSGSGYHEFDNK